MSKSKLDKVNVSEKVISTFLTDASFLQQLPSTVQNSSVMQKIRSATPTVRGRGHTRVLENITEQEWEDLYTIATAGRATILRGGRENISHIPWENVLAAGICATTLMERMETAGVASPVLESTRRQKAEPVTEAENVTDDAEDVEDAEDAEDTNLDSEVPAAPLTLEKADDVEEADEEVQNTFRQDLEQSNG